jgi:hypothetical protein
MSGEQRGTEYTGDRIKRKIVREDNRDIVTEECLPACIS